jgi:hypothetical protein
MTNTLLSNSPTIPIFNSNVRNFVTLPFVSLGATAANAQSKSEGGVEYDVANIPSAAIEMTLSAYAIPKYKGASRMEFKQGVLEDDSEFGQAGEGELQITKYFICYNIYISFLVVDFLLYALI